LPSGNQGEAHAASVEYHAFNRETRMQIETTKKLFTVDEYYRMAQAGIIGPDDRVELIDGEVLRMSPIGHRHSVCVTLATELFVSALKGRANVRIQLPLRLTDHTEPQPDVVLLRYRPDSYRGKEVTTQDVLLIVEVSDTTLQYDRDFKLARYAAAGIREVWIENIEADELLVYRETVGSAYAKCLVLRRGDSVEALAFPETTFKIDDLL